MKVISMVGAFALIVAGGAARADGVHWGPFKDDGCRAANAKQFSSILWDVPWGQSWEDTCWQTPGLDGRVPDRCVNAGDHMWGEWDIKDTACLP